VNTEALLSERGKTHGSFDDNARISQALKDTIRTSGGWEAMPTLHREATDFIAAKLARILSGQSLFQDHWDDIAGYAKLAAKHCDRDRIDQSWADAANEKRG
jgi:hypothetical protein